MAGPNSYDQRRVDALHEDLVGGGTLGQYPDTVMARLGSALNEAWALVEAAGLADQVKVIAGEELGPWSTPATKLDDITQQVLSRWRYDESHRPRTLAEAAAQLSELVRVLDANRGGTPSTPGNPSPGTLPAGTSQGTLIWAPDHAKRDSTAAGYRPNTQRQAGGGAIKNSKTDPIPIVDAPYGMGRALKFSIGANTTRLECNPPDHVNSFPASGERWFGFALALEEGFPINAAPYQVLAQLHGNDNTWPRFSLQVNSGELRVQDGKTVCPISTKRRYDIVFRAELGSGHITVWVDGQKRLDRWKCGTNNPPYYAKLGIYHRSTIGGGTAYHGPFRIGTGYGAVDPRK